ncbi:MAG: UDP-N-acetylmuramate--L-alanine ligase [Candidatus Moraniibacteriota bacterium]|jgi:UDP-N-acetylmuramate--alanine ligase
MKKIYIVGIGGAGTAALAKIYKEKGNVVSGSDEGDGFYVSNLVANNIEVFDKFDARHITNDIDFVVHTTAVKTDNIELQKANELSLEVLSYPEAIGKLTEGLKTIAVCGTHGKTTVTALTAHAFIEAGFSPTALVGSKIQSWGGGAYSGDGEYFILEADEYQNKLAFYNPFSVILTSVDFDHPDFFENFEVYKKTFSDFVTKIPEDGFLVAHGDDDDVRDVALSAKCQVFFYGERELNNCRITDRKVVENGQVVTVKFRGENHEIRTQLFGLHNAKNAVAAWLMNLLVTNEEVAGSEGINKCVGTSRRFEKKGNLNGAVLIDDYAHHPEEVSATLKTAIEIFKDKNIIAAFHPHTFSRTEALLEEFAQSLSIADEVIVLDIFASAREIVGNITSQDLVDKVNCDKKQNIHTVDELADWMKNNLTENDVFITLGAGDIWKVYDIIKE